MRTTIASGLSGGWSGLTASVLVVLSACGGGEPLPPRSAAPEALQHLNVYIDPNVTAVTTTEAVSTGDLAAVAKQVRASVARELSTAGFVITAVPDPGAVAMKLRVQVQGNHEAVVIAAMEKNGVEVGRAGYASARLDLSDMPDHAGIELVSALSRQRRFVEFARTGAPAPGAPLAAAPPAAPMAPPTPAAPAPAPAAADAPAAAAAGTFVVASPQPTAYALVIGIEQYRDLPSPTGARADAQRFTRVLRETYGLPENQVIQAIDAHAARSDLEKHLDALAARVRGGDRIFFFFSGHGAPDPSSGTSYLVPYDGDASALTRSALPLADVLNRLSQTKAKEVLAFVDTCFSGSGGRSVLPAGARPLVKVQTQQPTANVLLMTAASGAEISGPTEKGGSGLFSDYLVEALGTGEADLDGDGQITLKELQDWVRPRVAREAKRAGRDQTPGVVVAPGIDPERVIVGWGYRKAR